MRDRLVFCFYFDETFCLFLKKALGSRVVYKYQFILRIFPSVAMLLGGFDISARYVW